MSFVLRPPLRSVQRHVLGPLWSATNWNAGGTTTEGFGVASIDGQNVGSVQTFSSGLDLEGSMTFGATPFEHFGLATDLNGGSSSSWALFSTMGTSDTLFARTMLNGVETSVSLGGVRSAAGTRTALS